MKTTARFLGLTSLMVGLVLGTPNVSLAANGHNAGGSRVGGGSGNFSGSRGGSYHGGGGYHGGSHGYGHGRGGWGWWGGWFPSVSFYYGPSYSYYPYDYYYEAPPTVIYTAPPAPATAPVPGDQKVQTPPSTNSVPMTSVTDIKKLVKAQIGDNIIISQIKSSRSTYHLTASEIVDLKDAGVSEKVIDYMIKTGGR